MHVVGVVCGLSLSVIDSGFQLEWDPTTGPPPFPLAAQSPVCPRAYGFRLGESGRRVPYRNNGSLPPRLARVHPPARGRR